MNEYPITNEWRRGCYVAVITGQPHPKYGFEREFPIGHPIKSRRIVTYSAEVAEAPAWLIVQDTRARRMIAAGAIGWTDHGPIEVRDVLQVVATGLPDTEGAWTGDRCDKCASPILKARCLADCEVAAAKALQETARILAAREAQPAEEPF